MQGVLSANPKSTNEPADIIRLWVHENLRVFRDRLINGRRPRRGSTRSSATSCPSTSRAELFAKADANGDGCLQWEEVVHCEMSHLIYGDFMDARTPIRSCTRRSRTRRRW